MLKKNSKQLAFIVLNIVFCLIAFSKPVFAAAPVISDHPTSVTVCEGNTTNFLVIATGTTLTYQWFQKSPTGVWVKRTGATDRRLILTAVNRVLNGYKFRCTVTSQGISSVTSNEATLTVTSNPATITTQPQSQVVCSGSTVTFTAAASDASMVAQWYRIKYGSSYALPGENGLTLTLTNVGLDNNATYYKCVFTGGCFSPTTPLSTNQAYLTVNFPPSITTHPSPPPAVICPGATVTYSVAASGAGLIYTWQRSSNPATVAYTPIPGAASQNSYTFTASAALNGYGYRCVVSGTCGTSATSNSVTLAVPATIITTQPTSPAPVCPGSTASFSVTATGYGLSYQWQYSTSGTYYSNVSATELSGRTANYTPTTTASMNGYKYQCVVSGYCGSVTSSVATLTVTPSVGTPSIPAVSTTTICQGSGNTVFTTSATNATSYTWTVTGTGNTISGTGTTGTVTWSPSFLGNATVSVRANGCNGPSASAGRTVVIVQKPAPFYVGTSATGYCQGASGVNITLSSSQTGVNYLLMKNGVADGSPISGNGGELRWINKKNGTYSVLATNATTGCNQYMTGNWVITEYTIPGAPTVGTITQPTCGTATGSVVLGGLPSTGTWTINPGAITGTGTSYTKTGLTAGTYTYTVTNSSGCTSAVSGNVVINAQPPTPASLGAITGSTTVCQGQSGVAYTIPVGKGYGYLYNWYTASNANFVPQNWSLPSNAQWQELVLYLNANGYNWDGSISGDKLAKSMAKKSSDWTYSSNISNPGINDDNMNRSGFSALPGGFRGAEGNYYNYTFSASFWSKDIWTAYQNTAYFANIYYNSEYFNYAGNSLNFVSYMEEGLSVRLIYTGTGNPSFVTDIDGNIYEVVKIGNQFWTKQNWKCTHLNNGNEIPNVTDKNAWFSLRTLGRCAYNNQESYIGTLTNATSYTWTYAGGTGVTINNNGTSTPTLTFAANATSGTLQVYGVNGCGNGPVSSLAITVNPLPTLYTVGSSATAYCQGASGVTITLSGSQTGVNYQLIKNGVADGTPISGTGSALNWLNKTLGTYTVVATNATSACTQNMTGSKVITENPKPTAPTVNSITQPTCVSATGIVAFSGLPSGSWTLTRTPGAVNTSGSTVTATVSGIPSGTYTYTVTNSSGCTSTASGNVVINARPIQVAPTVGTITQPTCVSATGSVAFSGLPSGSWTLTRTPGAVTTTGSTVTATVSGIPTGTYTYTVTNASGCISTASGNVVINARPTQVAPTVGIITQPTCASATGSVVFSGLPSGSWTLTRTPGAVTTTGSTVTATVSGIPSGTYTYTVTNSSGCTSTASGNVGINAQPVTPTKPLTITGTTPVCPNTTGLTYSIAAVSGATGYTWSAPSGWSITSGQGTTSVVLATTSSASSGNISVTANNGYCTSAASTKAVTVTQIPSAPSSITGPGPIPVCPNETGLTYSITAVSGATGYTWSVPPGWSITSGQGTVSLVVSTSSSAVNGEIRVTANNCSGAGSAAVKYVQIWPKPGSTSPITGATTQCLNTEERYSISGGVQYATSYIWIMGAPPGWSFHISPEDILSSGANWVETKNTYIDLYAEETAISGNVMVLAKNCSGTSETVTKAVTVIPLPSLIVTQNAPSCNSSVQLTATGADAYTWTPATGLSCTDCANPITTQNGTYTVTGTKADGCSSQQSITVTAITNLPGLYTVYNSNDSGTGSLRAAIEASNANTENLPHQIVFCESGSPYSIVLQSELPNIIQSATIDGSNLSDYPEILNYGIKIRADNCKLNKLFFAGLVFSTGCIGQIDMYNCDNIIIENSIVSGATRALFATDCHGIYLYGSKFGTNKSGTADYSSNMSMGPWFENCTNLIIGNRNNGNIISGTGRWYPPNSSTYLSGGLTFKDCYHVIISGNLIGTDITGNISIPNIGDGIRIQSCEDFQIGGSNIGDENIIANNASGIIIYGYNSAINNSDIRIIGNKIGIGKDGTALGNGINGIYVYGGLTNSIIGGLDTKEGNIIANSGNTGIVFERAGNNNINKCSILKNSIFNNPKSFYFSYNATFQSCPNDGKQSPTITWGNCTTGIISGTSAWGNTAHFGDHIELFRSDANGINAYEFIGEATVGNDGAWTATGVNLNSGQVNYVIATITDAIGLNSPNLENTSRFSSLGTIPITCPNIAAIAPTTSCLGSPVTFTITQTETLSGETYSWNFGDGFTSTLKNPTHTYTATGSYNVALTITQPGCDAVTFSQNFVVSNISAPTLTITQPDCSVSTGTIQVSSPLGAEYEYSKDGTNYHPSSTFSGLAAGSYNITARNTTTACTSEIAQATINEAPTLPPALGDITGADEVCQGNTGEIYSIDDNSVGSGSSKPSNGYLYNWYAASQPNFAPADWKVPENSDLQEFTMFVSYYDGGGKLKEIGFTHWNSPNIEATDIFGFSALGSGMRIESGVFLYFKERGYMWGLEGSSYATSYYCSYDNVGFDNELSDFFKRGMSVRMLYKGSDAPPSTITDYDGNIYDVIPIGTQYWLKQNWACTKYNDGTPIPKVTDGTEWENLTTPAYCAYNNDETLVKSTDSGGIYTWDYIGGTGVTINGTGASVTLNFAEGATSGTLTVSTTNSCGTSESSLPITVNPQPQIPAATLTHPLCGQVYGTIQVDSPIEGTTYEYSTDGVNYQDSPTFIDKMPGSYNVTARNKSTLCTSVPLVVIIEPAPLTIPIPTIELIGSNPGCEGETVTLRASLADSYAWSNGATTQEITVNVTETFTVAVTKGTCTSANSEATIVTLSAIPAAPTLTLTQPVCGAMAGSIEITAPLGADLEYSINGTDYQAETLFANLAPKAYYVTARNTVGNCPSAATLAIIINPVGAPNQPTISVNNNESSTFCAGGNITLTSSAAQGNLWSNGETTRSIIVDAAGTYTVQVIDASCSSAVSDPLAVTVLDRPETPVATLTQPTCEVQSGALTITSPTGAGIIYSVTGYPFKADPTFSELPLRNYNVIAKNSLTGCQSIALAVLFDPIPLVPAKPVITANPALLFCEGGSTVLSSSSTMGNVWSNGETTREITANSAATYTVQVTSGACVSPVSDPVSTQTFPSFTLTDITYNNTCAGSPVTFKYEADQDLTGAEFVWEFGTGNAGSTLESPNYTYTQAGTYTVTLTVVVAGCPEQVLQKSITLIEGPVILGINQSQVCHGDSREYIINATTPFPEGETTYAWDFGDGTTSTLSNPIHAYELPGTYKLKLIVTTLQCGKLTYNKDIIVNYSVSFTGLNAEYFVGDEASVIHQKPIGVFGEFNDKDNIQYDEGQNLYVFTPLEAGTFNIVYEYNDGTCSSFFAQNVTVREKVRAYIEGNTSLCDGETSTDLKVVYTGEGEWSFNLGKNQASYFSAAHITDKEYVVTNCEEGTYNLITVLDKDGMAVNTDNSSVEVIQRASPMAVFGGNGSGCLGVDPPIYIDFTKGAPSYTVSYKYNGTEFSETTASSRYQFDNAAEGSYQLTEVKNSFCTTPLSEIREVSFADLPPVSINDLANSYCKGDDEVTFTGSPGGGTYSGPGFVTQTDGSCTFNPFKAGSFTLTYSYTDPVSGCRVQAIKTVIVHERPTAEITGSAYLCGNEGTSLQVTLKGAQNYTLEYQKAGVSESVNLSDPSPLDLSYIWEMPISANAVGDYQLVSVTANGCLRTNLGSGTTIEQHPIPTATIRDAGEPEVCAGVTLPMEIEFTGTQPFTYMLLTPTGPSHQSIDAVLASYNLSLSGTYKLASFKDAYCDGTVSGEIKLTVKEVPKAKLMGSGGICKGQEAEMTIEFSGPTPYSYEYKIDDDIMEGLVPDQENVVVLKEALPKTYQMLRVWNELGCEGLAEGTVAVMPKELPVVSMSVSDGGRINANQEAEIVFDFEKGEADWVVTYSINGNVQEEIVASESPYVLTTNVAGVYRIVSINDPYCEGEQNTDKVLVSINGEPLPCKECISSFAPIPGEKYILSAWVKQSVLSTNGAYSDAGIEIAYEGVNETSGVLMPKGGIIDGWQKIDEEFVIPFGTTAINVKLVNGSLSPAFFDDIRIQPFKSSMKTYVYDPITLKLSAELDENNYATFYEYDEEGALVRIKKETDRGVKTIQESFNNKAKKVE